MQFKVSTHWVWFYQPSMIDNAIWNDYADALTAFIKICPYPSIALTVAEADAQAPTPLQRERLAIAIQNADPTRLTGNALVMKSMLARGALMAVQWLSKPKYQQKITSDLSSAYDWLATRTTPEHLASLREDFEKTTGVRPSP